MYGISFDFVSGLAGAPVPGLGVYESTLYILVFYQLAFISCLLQGQVLVNALGQLADHCLLCILLHVLVSGAVVIEVGCDDGLSHLATDVGVPVQEG